MNLKTVIRILALLSALLSIGSCLFFYDHYWRIRDQFNDQGRYFDPVTGVAYLEQAGIFWAVAVFLFALLPLLWLVKRF